MILLKDGSYKDKKLRFTLELRYQPPFMPYIRIPRYTPTYTDR